MSSRSLVCYIVIEKLKAINAVHELIANSFHHHYFRSSFLDLGICQEVK